jgi:hypothetical protein
MIFKSARTRGLTNPRSKRTIHLRGLCGPLIRLPIEVSRIACWKCQRNNATGIPISRYKKSWHNLSRQIKITSGPLIRVSRITCWKCQRNNATKISISRYEKSRHNLSRQIKNTSEPSTQLTSTDHVNQEHVSQLGNDKCQTDSTF